MDVLKGLLLINDVDIFTVYGAFLVEEKPGENKNYSSLLKPPATKTHTAVSFREQDGEKLPETLVPAWEARDVTLHFAIMASDRRQFLIRYSAFLAFLFFLFALPSKQARTAKERTAYFNPFIFRSYFLMLSNSILNFKAENGLIWPASLSAYA